MHKFKQLAAWRLTTKGNLKKGYAGLSSDPKRLCSKAEISTIGSAEIGVT
jgi:hypothetical protein